VVKIFLCPTQKLVTATDWTEYYCVIYAVQKFQNKFSNPRGVELVLKGTGMGFQSV